MSKRRTEKKAGKQPMRADHKMVTNLTKKNILQKNKCEIGNCTDNVQVEISRPKENTDPPEQFVQKICWRHGYTAMCFHVQQQNIKMGQLRKVIDTLEDKTHLKQFRKQLTDEIQRANDTYILYKQKMEPNVPEPEYHTDYAGDAFEDGEE